MCKMRGDDDERPPPEAVLPHVFKQYEFRSGDASIPATDEIPEQRTPRRLSCLHLSLPGRMGEKTNGEES